MATTSEIGSLKLTRINPSGFATAKHAIQNASHWLRSRNQNRNPSTATSP